MAARHFLLPVRLASYRTVKQAVFPVRARNMTSLVDLHEERVHGQLETGQHKVIGTHNGTFHCDEALAVFLLRLTESYKDAELVRTRDPLALSRCNIVVDVGGVYDIATQRFDHHQRGFTEVFGTGGYDKTKLSSAGLVYKHFGKEIIARRLGVQPSHQSVDILYTKLYGTFIEPIDAIDNGISQYDPSLSLVPRYKISTDLSSRVSWLNPEWNETADSTDVNARFAQASNLTGTEFLGRLDYYAKSWLPARDIVLQAVKTRKQIHPSGKIVLLTPFAPWKEHLFNIEDEQSIVVDEKPLYVIYPDETGDNWRVQAVPSQSDSFENRKSLPEAWRGLRDDALSNKTGVAGCIFVHASGFIGGNKTQDGALELARCALKISP